MNTAACVLLILTSSCAVMSGGRGSSRGARVTATGHLYEIVVRNDQMYVNARVTGHYDVKSRIVVTAAGVTQAIEMESHKSYCDGANPDWRDDEIDYQRECSVELGGRAGTYHVVLEADGRTIDQREVVVRPEPTLTGEPQLRVDPSSLTETVRLDGNTTTYWYVRDVRDPKATISMIWIDGDQLISNPEPSVSGGPRLQDFGMLRDVAIASGPAIPKAYEGKPVDLQLVVIEDGVKLLGTFDGNGSRPIDVLRRSNKPPSDAAVAAAMKLGRAHHQGHKNNAVQELDRRWPEQIVCAVASDKAARKALTEMLRDKSAAHWDWYDGAVAHDAAIDEDNDKKRAKLEKRMVDKFSSRSANLASGNANARTLDKIARTHKPGCFDALFSK